MADEATDPKPTPKAKAPSNTVKVELVAGKPEPMDRAACERLAATGHTAAKAALAD